jgi:hypothetical protein
MIGPDGTAVTIVAKLVPSGTQTAPTLFLDEDSQVWTAGERLGHLGQVIEPPAGYKRLPDDPRKP